MLRLEYTWTFTLRCNLEGNSIAASRPRWSRLRLEYTPGITHVEFCSWNMFYFEDTCICENLTIYVWITTIKLTWYIQMFGWFEIWNWNSILQTIFCTLLFRLDHAPLSKNDWVGCEKRFPISIVLKILPTFFFQNVVKQQIKFSIGN